ncbi:FHA domain-containing protein [Nitriliruptor alkaliphilus]|uniref:FHA domain-containing protein n=1 Tax=Nitriliruptor alkaliphilus TaxID=427918 RepID=UPI000AAE4ED3|nr:FHA domain-containing protein [Nitriliruptor alkaliphilus]
MFCSHCGQPMAEDARFCAACGAPVSDAAASANDTTASIELGALDPSHEPQDLPLLEAGTGMLVVVRGPNAGSRFLLDRDITTVGRHPDADIFLDDVTVSRRHAELHRTDEGVLVRDLGSLNGSYVNGERVEERLLVTSEELQIGRFKLLFVGADGATR